MRIVKSRVNAGWMGVHISPDELDCGQKKYPHHTCIGMIKADLSIDVWTPVGYKPRGYKAAATRMMKEVVAGLKAGTLTPVDPIQP